MSLTAPIVGNWVGPKAGMDIMVAKGKGFAPAANSTLLAHSLVAIVTEFSPILV
jgi:hypothetical protein